MKSRSLAALGMASWEPIIPSDAQRIEESAFGCGRAALYDRFHALL